MPKNPPPPICPKCSMPMRFVLVKTGGRKFRCVDCDVTGLLKLPEVTQLLSGELDVQAKLPPLDLMPKLTEAGIQPRSWRSS